MRYHNGERVRSYYSGFKADKFKEFADPAPAEAASKEESSKSWIDLKPQHSLFDDICKDCPAQYANENGTPTQKWENVKTLLKDILTSKLHYVKVPETHIVIDFDIPGDDGKKCFERNLEAASKWPATYAELSKSGAGIHLHYIYTGDASKLSRVYDEHIEVKVFTGNSSLRRMLTKCNDIPIAKISSGLPLKGEKAMVDVKQIQNEKHLRVLIKKALAKEISPYTKPSIDFIAHIMDEAYESGIPYNVDDMRNAILAFAVNSTNQADACLKITAKMHFKSREDVESQADDGEKAPIVFFDCEVFPNLFLVNWKFAGEDKPVNRLINPSPTDIEKLTQYRLIGFNNRKYDNHMLWACMLGWNTEQLYALSNRIINDHMGFFGEAYNLSYTDIYDFSAKKQSLKKFEIELGIHHQELGLPWDQPVPEEKWEQVAEYCDNDVIATEAVFNARQADFIAREILADVAGMTVNDTTNSLTTRIIFGKEKHPQLVYTDLATGKSDSVVEVEPDILTNKNIINAFPGYEWVRGEDGRRPSQ